MGVELPYAWPNDRKLPMPPCWPHGAGNNIDDELLRNILPYYPACRNSHTKFRKNGIT